MGRINNSSETLADVGYGEGFPEGPNYLINSFGPKNVFLFPFFGKLFFFSFFVRKTIFRKIVRKRLFSENCQK